MTVIYYFTVFSGAITIANLTMKLIDFIEKRGK